MMIFFPKAKINLGLRITGKRHDGFHNIETIFYPVMLCDALEFIISPEPKKNDILTTTGLQTGVLPEDNLVMKSVRLLRSRFSFPFLKIHLHKAIPAGAGLGGGSSDAAGILRGINNCYGLSINDEELKGYALEMGSDCPFFIGSCPSLARGRGEILEPLDNFLSGYHILLINPGIGISTREAYNNCHPEPPHTNLRELVDLPVDEWKEVIINDFEEYVFKKYPITGSIKNSLYEAGAIYSSLSGSGSTVYGIFPERPVISDKLKDFVIYDGVL
jgi:4-diphosphocytidyl-2-C-methyl-D-erythritol kinase